MILQIIKLKIQLTESAQFGRELIQMTGYISSIQLLAGLLTEHSQVDAHRQHVVGHVRTGSRLKHHVTQIIIIIRKKLTGIVWLDLFQHNYGMDYGPST